MKPQHIPSRTHQLYIEVVVKVLDFITTAFQLVKIGCRHPNNVA